MGEDTMGRIRWRGFRRRLGQPIGLHAHKKPRAEILREAEEFVDVTFPIAHVHAALGRADKRYGLAQILKPAIAFLGLDRHASLIHEALERGRSFELVARPELHRRQAERRPAGGDGQTRMHQHAAQGPGIGLSGLVAPRVDGLREADLAGRHATVDELGRVLQNQNRPFAGFEARCSRSEMSRHHAVFGDARIVEKSIGRLRRSPIATGRWNRLTRGGGQLLQQPP